MIIQEIEVKDNSFSFNGKPYDCSYIIERDKKLIFQEAATSHPNIIEEVYVKDSLSPKKAKLYLDKDGNPIAIMIVYIIEYKDRCSCRLACGDYYIVESAMADDNLRGRLFPHPYQASICW